MFTSNENTFIFILLIIDSGLSHNYIRRLKVVTKGNLNEDHNNFEIFARNQLMNGIKYVSNIDYNHIIY